MSKITRNIRCTCAASEFKDVHTTDLVQRSGNYLVASFRRCKVHVEVETALTSSVSLVQGHRCATVNPFSVGTEGRRGLTFVV